jgi:PilZ domain-containing protein
MSAASARRAELTIEELEAACSGAAPPGSERRREPRDPYTGQVSVKLAVRTSSIVTGGVYQQVCVEVFSRNLSKSGFGFLVPPIYLPEAGFTRGIAMRGEDVFEVGKRVEIAIVRPEGPTQWMPARVLRARPMEGGFVECGVEFI